MLTAGVTAILVVDIILMFVTISGNLLSLFAIILCRKLSEVVSNYFIFSLALSDLMVGVTIPYHSFFAVGSELGSNKKTCILRFMLVIFACSSSIYNLLAIAADRYVAVVHPLHYNKYMSKKIVSCIIIFGWIITFIAGAVILYWNNWKDGQDCSLNHVVPKEYLAYILSPMFVSIWLAMLVVYLKIWRIASVHAKRIKKEIHHKNMCVSDSKSVQVVMLILGCFSLCWLPYFVVVICLKLFGEVSTILYEVTFTMAMANSCMNPIIYAWKNPGFRKAFWCMVRCKSPNQNRAAENYVTNHTPMYGAKRPTLTSNGKSDSLSNQTEIELYDGKSQTEDNRDWDQESTDNTVITTASTITKETQNYI